MSLPAPKASNTATLRERYIEDAFATVRFFEDHLRRTSADELTGLNRQLHRLKGSGGTYGYPSISAAAGTAHDLLLANPSQALAHPSFRCALTELIEAIEEAHEKRPTYDVSTVAGPLPQTASSRVLIVDDDPAVTNLLRARFTEAGYAVTTARDGMTALAAMFETKPDLVILDRDLPLIGGEAVMFNLASHEQWASIPVIILSATEQGPENARLSMAKAYVPKPFCADRMLDLSAEVLRTAAAREITAGFPNRKPSRPTLSHTFEDRSQ